MTPTFSVCDTLSVSSFSFWMHVAQVLGIFCSEKTLTQSSFWRRRFIWFISYSPSSGRPRQELKTGMWKEELKQSHEWGLATGLFLMTGSAYILSINQDFLEAALSSVVWALLHQQSIKTPHRHGHRQSDRGIFPLRICFQIILTSIMKTKQTNKQNDQRSSVCSNQLHLCHGFTKIILQVHLWIFIWTLYSPKPMVEHRYVCVMDWKWCSGRLKTLYTAS